VTAREHLHQLRIALDTARNNLRPRLSDRPTSFQYIELPIEFKVM
jgi:hypothetical protein